MLPRFLNHFSKDRDSQSTPSSGDLWSHYNLLPPRSSLSSGSETPPYLDPRHQGKKTRPSFITLSLGAVLTSILLATSIKALIDIGNYHPQYGVAPSRYSLQSCGPTAATARERGCHFDLMSASWVQEDCFDVELMRDYVHTGFNERNWTFSWDVDGKPGPVMTKAEVLSGEWEIIWASGDFHYAHCAYFWEKQWKQFSAGGKTVVLDSRIRFPHHTKHCIDFVRAPNITYIQGIASSMIHQRFGLLECVVGPM
ncbi:hypothetical protein CMUS01_03282 [Colletotrichum musicola]|uniref:Uncharacterized protein n=1 Tax=Colletotrichum musicola TaxID=2175873 RepID=A0A8H6NT99_9PEZI|nr:hypothetical protein CMUS01_03282 [Colletotrichum musicola]